MGLEIGSDIACNERYRVSFADSEAETYTAGTEVIFSLLEADNGDKIPEITSDSICCGAETSSAKDKLCKSDPDIKLLDSSEGDKISILSVSISSLADLE